MVYVVLDGFDLGVGILFGTTRDAALREEMMATISPFWDGNETWLVVIGASLFAAFPIVYAVFLPAFYIPVLLLLVRVDLPWGRLRVPLPGQRARIVGLGVSSSVRRSSLSFRARRSAP